TLAILIRLFTASFALSLYIVLVLLSSYSIECLFLLLRVIICLLLVESMVLGNFLSKFSNLLILWKAVSKFLTSNDSNIALIIFDLPELFDPTIIFKFLFRFSSKCFIDL